MLKFWTIWHGLIIVKCQGSMKREPQNNDFAVSTFEKFTWGKSLYSDRNLWKRFMGRLTGAVIILLWLMDLKHRGFFEASLWGAKVKQKALVMCRQRHLSPQHFNVFWRLTLPIALKPQISSLSKHLWTKYRQIHLQIHYYWEPRRDCPLVSSNLPLSPM